MASRPGVISGPSPTTMSSMTRSAGGWAGTSTIGLLCVITPTISPAAGGGIRSRIPAGDHMASPGRCFARPGLAICADDEFEAGGLEIRDDLRRVEQAEVKVDFVSPPFVAMDDCAGTVLGVFDVEGNQHVAARA